MSNTQDPIKLALRLISASSAILTGTAGLDASKACIEAAEILQSPAPQPETVATSDERVRGCTAGSDAECTYRACATGCPALKRQAAAQPQGDAREAAKNPHFGRLREYWQDGFEGRPLEACTGQAPIDAWHEGRQAAATAQASEPVPHAFKEWFGGGLSAAPHCAKCGQGRNAPIHAAQASEPPGDAREAFEAWARKVGWPHCIKIGAELVDNFSIDSWNAWQAATAQVTTKSARPCTPTAFTRSPAMTDLQTVREALEHGFHNNLSPRAEQYQKALTALSRLEAAAVPELSLNTLIELAGQVGVKEYGPNTRNWSFEASQLVRFASLVRSVPVGGNQS